MNNKLLPIAMMFSSVFSISAMAADGQVNFSGEIIDSACQVINTPSNPLQVTLGQVNRSAFSGAGSTAAATKFTLQLADCPVSATAAAVKFDGSSISGNNSVLALTQEPGVASGVGIQLSDDSNTVVPLYTASKRYNLNTGTGVVNNLDFVARYIATAASVTAGPANSMASFTVIYN